MRWSSYLTVFLLGALSLPLMGVDRCGVQPPKLLRVYNVHVDRLGSTGLITSTPGAVTDENGVFERTTYTPYGDISTRVGNRTDGFPEYSYTGQEYDPESGLHYFRARYYDPTVGRFLSPDPALNGGGVSFSRLASAPQQLNGYSYVQNDPVNRVDPSGLFDLQLGLGFGTLSLGSSGAGFSFGPSLGVSAHTGIAGFSAIASYSGGLFSGTLGGDAFGANLNAGFDLGGGIRNGFVNTPFYKAGLSPYTVISRPAPDPVPSEYYDQGPQRHLALSGANGKRVEFGPFLNVGHSSSGLDALVQWAQLPERLRLNNPLTVSNTQAAIDAGTARTLSMNLNPFRAERAIARISARTESASPIYYDAFISGKNSNSPIRDIARAGGGKLTTFFGYNTTLGFVPSGAPWLPNSLKDSMINAR